MSHEDFGRKEHLKTGSDRGFGLTVGGVLVTIGVIRTISAQNLGYLEILLLAGGGILTLFAFAAPHRLSSFNTAWMKFGLLLSKIVTPVVMGLIFYTTVTPTGWLLKAFGKNLLDVRKDPTAESYWVDRAPPGPEPETMKNQF